MTKGKKIPHLITITQRKLKLTPHCNELRGLKDRERKIGRKKFQGKKDMKLGLERETGEQWKH